MNLKSIPFLTGMLLLTVLFACKKTMDLPAQPNNRILEYKVTNVQDTVIYGAIDEIEKSITVYVPFYYNLAVIDPEIKLSDGAKLQEPANAVEVNRTDVVYKVKATDGTIASYKLKIVVQNAGDLFIKELSSASSTAVFYPNALLNVSGNFFTNDGAVVDTWLVAKNGGKETSIRYGILGGGRIVENGEVIYTISYNTLLPTLDSGLYHIKVKVFGQTALSKFPIRISYKQPDIAMVGRELKQGESFSYNVVPGTVFTGIKSVAVADDKGVFRNLIIGPYTRTQLMLQVPEDFPPGDYLQLRIEFDSWNTLTKNFITFKVNPK